MLCCGYTKQLYLSISNINKYMWNLFVNQIPTVSMIHSKRKHVTIFILYCSYLKLLITIKKAFRLIYYILCNTSIVV